MGIYADYISLLNKTKYKKRPFDSANIESFLARIEKAFQKNPSTEQLLLLVKQYQAIILTKKELSDCAQFLKQSIETMAITFPLEDETQYKSLIFQLAQLFKIIASALEENLEDDLTDEQEIKNFTKNFLRNALRQAGLLNTRNERLFYTDLLNSYDADVPLEACDEAFQHRLNNKALTKKNLLTYLAVRGEDYLTHMLINTYQNMPDGQNKLVNLLQSEFNSLEVGLTFTEEEKKLKNILDDKVFPKISLPRNKTASQLREFDTTINLLREDIANLASTAQATDLSLLNSEDKAKLEIFLAPYKKLAEMDKPFSHFNEEAANQKGLKVVSTTTGGLYVGLSDSNQAEDFVDNLKETIASECFKPETSDFLNLLILCTATQGAFATFVREMKIKYGIDNHHPLYNLCKKCDTNSSQAITIKTVQVLPRLSLLAGEIYNNNMDGENNISEQQQVFINATNRGNTMQMQAFIEDSFIQHALQNNPHIPSSHIHFITEQFSLPDTQIKLKEAMKQKLKGFKSNNNGNGNGKELMLSMLLNCRKYYTLNMPHSPKALSIVKELDILIRSLAEDRDNFSDLVSIQTHIEKLKKGEYRSQRQRFFCIDDTLTSTIKDTLNAIEQTKTSQLCILGQ